MALVLTVPVIVLMGLFAYLCNRVSFYDGSLLWLFVVLAALTVAHELVHGIFWSILQKAAGSPSPSGLLCKASPLTAPVTRG